MKTNRLDKNGSLEPDATLPTDQGVQIEQTVDSLHGGVARLPRC